MIEFTVAICTYRRAALLPTTLASLAAVEAPEGAAWELLLVDNGCEEAVERVAESFRGRLPIRYVREPQTGIARARNRAADSAAGPVLIFADDDVTFDRRWLVRMIGSVRERPECAFWGGRIRPVFTDPPPAWFDTRRCPMLGDAIVRYDLGEAPRYWDPAQDPPFYTCNLALRLEAVRAAGMFDVSLGHRGSKRGGGEDSWMIKSISRAGGKGWYAADAVLDHPVEAKRLGRPYARRFAWYQGAVSVDMLRREHGRRVPRWLYRAAAEQTAAGAGRWFAGLVRGDAGQAFAGQITTIFNVSKLWNGVKGEVRSAGRSAELM